MTTQELKNKIEKVLGNSIRCLLPSYWWKNLFHSVADRIDEVETTVTENVNDMVVKSLNEFAAKRPDMASNTLILTEDETSDEARSNATKLIMWVRKMINLPAKSAVNPLYIAVPILDEETAYSIQTPMYGLGKQGIIFYDVRMPDGQIFNIEFELSTGVVSSLQPASSSGGGSVRFVVNPTGDLTEEQKQNNADAYLKVTESGFAIDINILVMVYIAKPNMVSVNDNGDLVLLAAGIDGGASKFIVTPEGDVTIEPVEPTSSGGVEIRELRISDNLSDEDKAYNIETVRKYKEGKALVVAPIGYRATSTERTDRMQMPSYVDLYTNTEVVGATFTFMTEGFNGEKYLINCTIKDDGSIVRSLSYTFDSEMSDESVNAVQNKVIKAYVDGLVAATKGELAKAEKVHAAALVDLDTRIQDIVTRLSNAGL